MPLKKILLIRFSSIGDIVLTTPVIRALKQQTDAELHILTKSSYAAIYRSNPYLKQIHLIEKLTKKGIKVLQEENFDLVIDLQKNLKSYRVKRLLGRPGTSFPKLNKEKWLLVNFKINRLPNIHIVDRYFEAVNNLGVVNDGLGLDYFIPEQEYVNPGSISAKLEEPYIAYAIGGQHKTKIMPPEKIAAIISKLSAPVVLLGSDSDKSDAQNIASMCSNPDVFNLCGSYSLDQSASLLKQSRLVISHDTGLMHIAAAFKKDIISIWGNTIPELGMHPYFPKGEALSIISEVKDLKCRPCSKIGFEKCPKKHFKCMLDQDESSIIDQANRIISKKL